MRAEKKEGGKNPDAFTPIWLFLSNRFPANFEKKRQALQSTQSSPSLLKKKKGIQPALGFLMAGDGLLYF